MRYSNDKPVMVKEGMEFQVCLELTSLVRGEAGAEGEKKVYLLWERTPLQWTSHRSRN